MQTAAQEAQRGIQNLQPAEFTQTRMRNLSRLATRALIGGVAFVTLLTSIAACAPPPTPETNPTQPPAPTEPATVAPTPKIIVADGAGAPSGGPGTRPAETPVPTPTKPAVTPALAPLPPEALSQVEMKDVEFKGWKGELYIDATGPLANIKKWVLYGKYPVVGFALNRRDPLEVLHRNGFTDEQIAQAGVTAADLAEVAPSPETQLARRFWGGIHTAYLFQQAENKLNYGWSENFQRDIADPNLALIKSGPSFEAFMQNLKGKTVRFRDIDVPGGFTVVPLDQIKKISLIMTDSDPHLKLTSSQMLPGAVVGYSWDEKTGTFTFYQSDNYMPSLNKDGTELDNIDMRIKNGAVMTDEEKILYAKMRLGNFIFLHDADRFLGYAGLTAEHQKAIVFRGENNKFTTDIDRIRKNDAQIFSQSLPWLFGQIETPGRKIAKLLNIKDPALSYGVIQNNAIVLDELINPTTAVLGK